MCARVIQDLTVVLGNFLAVQWLRLHASTTEGMGSVPGWGTKIPHTAWHGQKKKVLISLSWPILYNLYFIDLKINFVTSVYEHRIFYQSFIKNKCSGILEDGKKILAYILQQLLCI